jgi:hypothetical protein
MGRRSEPRTAISFPVFVRGFDSRGSPFAVSTETFDVSSTGASVKGLEGLVEPGSKIEIEFKDQKSWYRVQWVGKNGSGKAGRIGVHCLERKYIWDVAPRRWDADTYGGSGVKAATVPWSGEERRLFGRRSCRIGAQASIPGSSVSLPGKVTDISLGGCYVETLAPLPVDTMIELALTAGDTTLCASGKVRSSQTGLGMGVAFASMSPGDFETLRKFSLAASGSPEITMPVGQTAQQLQTKAQVGSPLTQAARSNHGSSLTAPPKHLPTTAEALEAVIRVLLRKGLLARDELTEELDRVKATKNQP